MKKKNRKIKWNAKNLLVLENYVLSNSEKLLSNFYMNILVGYIRFPKPYGFFKNLSNKLRIPAQSCSNKYYKLEENFYTQLLSVPKRHYRLFFSIRQQAKTDKKMKPYEADPIEGFVLVQQYNL